MSFLLGTLLHSLRESTFKMIIRFKGVFYKCILFMLTSTVVVWMSVFLYGTFYYTYMPSVSHVKPVHFQFRPCETGDGPCSFPVANLSLIKKGHDQLLMRGQQYKVYLELNLPESQKNQQVGMFMVKIDFYARKGEIVHSSARAAMLRYKSSLLYTLATVVFSPLLLMGSMDERQILTIELFDYYEEDPTRPAIGTVVEIQSRNVQIYSAALHIYAHFTGLRYLMFNWPLLSAIIGIGTILFFLCIVALLSWYRFSISAEKTQVVVKVGFDDATKGVGERRKQVRDFLLRERKRQSSLREGGNNGSARAPALRLTDRTRSLETLPIPRVQELSQESTKEPAKQSSAGKKDLDAESDHPEPAQLDGDDDDATGVRQRKTGTTTEAS